MDSWACDEEPTKNSTSRRIGCALVALLLMAVAVLLLGVTYSTMDLNQRLQSEIALLRRQIDTEIKPTTTTDGSVRVDVSSETKRLRKKLSDGSEKYYESNVHSIPSKELSLPEGLSDSTYSQLWTNYYQCDELYANPRPVPTQDSWMMLRGIYYGTLHGHISTTLEQLMQENSIKVPFTVKHVEGKGRGIFAKQNIAKGSLVFSALDGGHLHFETGDQFRRFLGALTREQSCEVLQCSAVENHGTKEDPRSGALITADLDYGCFVNSCNTPEEVNAGCIEGRDCINNDYALRDIKAGEEIIMNYGDYALTQGWAWFGL